MHARMWFLATHATYALRCARTYIDTRIRIHTYAYICAHAMRTSSYIYTDVDSTYRRSNQTPHRDTKNAYVTRHRPHNINKQKIHESSGRNKAKNDTQQAGWHDRASQY